ncbi:MAG: hypothetical protein AMJ90_10040 [candidate division Zixibacteria bacterium SM23_73_2]|nr:MAG: hypothetical protein AMJ90_10040 [candidate division Zixibacteria bacterium SM23_73_2]
MWKQNSKIFACSLYGIKVEPSYFRSLIAGQLMSSSLLDWKGYKLNKDLRKKAKLEITKLMKKWRGIS